MIAALELRPAAATGWLLDDGANPVQTRARPLTADLSPAQRWLELVETARQICFAGVIEPAQLSRVVLVFPGEVDTRGVVRSGDLSGFGGYDLRRGLREHLGTEAELVVASATVADAWAQTHAGTLREISSWLYLSLNAQIEAVACVGGAWLQSPLGALVLERDGPLDSNGRRGTLSAFCAGRDFEERARSYALNASAAQVWEMAPSNFAARSLAESYVTRLAQGLANAIAALCPQRVCIGGELGRALFGRIEADLASELRDYLPPNLWRGDLALSAPGEAGSIAPGVLALAALGNVPL